MSFTASSDPSLNTPVLGDSATAIVVAVSQSQTHTFSKANQTSIQLMTDLGVLGDAHLGSTVKHRSRVAQDPTQPNLRQVHLIHAELHDELRAAGFAVTAGEMGENITTRGLNLLGLPTNTRLHIGPHAILKITGLRNPCTQLDAFQPGLMAATLGRDENGDLIRKAGIMAIVIVGGFICPNDTIRVELPPQPYQRLERV